MNHVQATLLERLVATLCKAVLWITSSVIFLILTANTLLRYAAGSSLQWANEVPELMFPWLVMAGIVLASLHGAHIATTFLMESVPAKVRRVVAVVGWLTVASMYLTLSSATYNMLEIVHDEKSPILGVPGSVTYGCMLGAMVLLAVLALQSAWRCAWGVSPVAGNHGDGAGPSAAQG